MGLKKVSIANFNTVFLLNDEERPLLDYFDTILMPALGSNIVREINGDKYFFMNIRVIEEPSSNYILTGLIVKKTVLETALKGKFRYGLPVYLKFPDFEFSV